MDEAKCAARKAKQLEQAAQDHTYRLVELFKRIHNYCIEKINEYKNGKFNATRSDWKIFGHVDIFKIPDVMQELIAKMTDGLNDNVKLQIILENDRNDMVNQTKLLNKIDMIEKLFDWVSLFINYQDMEIEDITFKLLKIEIPEGAGKVNRIITVRRKRSIIEIVNIDTLCLARAIVVGLASLAREHLESIFKDKVTKSEITK